MERRKIIGFSIFLFVILIMSFVGGQYLGGYIFLKMAHISMSYLSYDTLYQYYQSLNGYAEYRKLLIAGGIGAFTPLLVPVFLLVAVIIGSIKKEELHGSARLANDRDLAETPLFPNEAEFGKSKYPEILLGKIPNGRFKGQYIRFSGQQFVYIAAPTRSGKGVGIVIPNLLNYRDSVVVLDIKLENFFYTAGYRKAVGQEVFLFSPDGFAESEEVAARGELRSHRWNPLTYVRRNPIFRNSDIGNITKILFPTNGGDNEVWNEAASNLFKGLVLYMIDIEDTGSPVTINQLLKLTAPKEGLSKWMKSEISIAEKRGKPLSESCTQEFYRFIAAPEKTQGSILTNLASPLGVFSNAACAAATSGDDFDLREVRKKRMSIYLGLAPNNIKSYSKLINLFFSQLISENTGSGKLPEQNPDYKYQCLMVLDEFTSMGYVEIIETSIAYNAGYNMRYMLIIQTKGQIEVDKLYGKDGAKALQDNCAVHIIYPPKKAGDDANDVSETIGYKTVKSKSRSKTLAGASSHGSKSDSITDQKRAVLLPQEVVELGIKTYKGRNGKLKRKKIDIGINEIIIMEKVRPFLANKIIYFDEPEFNARKQYSLDNKVEVPLLDFSSLNMKAPDPKDAAVPQLKDEP